MRQALVAPENLGKRRERLGIAAVLLDLSPSTHLALAAGWRCACGRISKAGLLMGPHTLGGEAIASSAPLVRMLGLIPNKKI
jgi:hypothetical protein